MNNSWAALLNMPNYSTEVASAGEFTPTNFQPSVDAKAIADVGKRFGDARRTKEKEAEERKKSADVAAILIENQKPAPTNPNQTPVPETNPWLKNRPKKPSILDGIGTSNKTVT